MGTFLMSPHGDIIKVARQQTVLWMFVLCSPISFTSVSTAASTCAEPCFGQLRANFRVEVTRQQSGQSQPKAGSGDRTNRLIKHQELPRSSAMPSRDVWSGDCRATRSDDTIGS